MLNKDVDMRADCAKILVDTDTLNATVTQIGRAHV